MQSLHICRTELLETQEKAGKTLKQLMDLNNTARSLRIALKIAEAALIAAYATENPAIIAEAQVQVDQIKLQQKALDALQKSLILRANTQLFTGVQKAARLLREQDQWNQAHMSDILSFKIRHILAKPTTLAVKPDQPDVAPVYELKNDFTEAQALHVSWTSEFQTRWKENLQWLSNHHNLKQACSASLKSEGRNFPEVLHEAKPWSKW